MKWVPIIGFEGRYDLSKKGEVKSLPKFRNTGTGGYVSKEKLLTPKIQKKGYRFFELRKNNKAFCYKRSRLVAIHFIPNPLNLKEVNHKNGIKSDDRISNLEWITSSDNQKHAYRTGLKKAAYLGKFGKDHNQSIPIMATLGKDKIKFESKTECGKYFGVTVQAVAQAIKKGFKCKKYSLVELCQN